MELDDLADLVADLPEAITRQIIESLSQQDRERLESVLSFPEDTAGGLMDPDTITVRPDVSLDVVSPLIELAGDLSYLRVVVGLRLFAAWHVGRLHHVAASTRVNTKC